LKVVALAKTQFYSWDLPGKASGSEFQKRIAKFEDDRNYVYVDNENEVLTEFAGRLCYESWDLPNEETATQEGYIANILKQAHESILEHTSITFYVEGVSRNLSHELIRHRHLSFSELSQRFVDVSVGNFVNPPAIREYPAEGDEDGWTHPTQPVSDTEFTDYYNSVYHNLKNDGKTRKQAREAARYFLPAGMETKFVVTGNLRAWRDVLKKRDSEHADAEMQLFAKEIKQQLLDIYPNIFADLT
jgi:thymidylate synthase (FAD)